MLERLEIIKVNKMDPKNNWASQTYFSHFRVRAVLKEQTDMIAKINAKHQLTRRLRREIGVEGEDWILQTNERTGEDELYLPNSGKLLMWKLQDAEKFSGLFEKVEQHKEDIDEVREDE